MWWSKYHHFTVVPIIENLYKLTILSEAPMNQAAYMCNTSDDWFNT